MLIKLIFWRIIHVFRILKMIIILSDYSVLISIFMYIYRKILFSPFCNATLWIKRKSLIYYYYGHWQEPK